MVPHTQDQCMNMLTDMKAKGGDHFLSCNVNDQPEAAKR